MCPKSHCYFVIESGFRSRHLGHQKSILRYIPNQRVVHAFVEAKKVEHKVNIEENCKVAEWCLDENH